MYQVKRASNSEFVPIRNLSYHVRTWGTPSPDRTPLVMVHGWMDVGASYQFVIDAFSEAFATGRHIIAPDWRGYGLTGTAGPPQGADGPLGGQRGHEVPSVGATYQDVHDNYWFPDYLADLDFLLDHYAPDRAVDLVGHSMGGNVVMQYAGVRPERIRRLINLEGFGMPATKPSQAPGRYAKWMDELKSLHRGELALKSYDSSASVARRLMKTNPRLGQDKAEWLAQHWARENAPGQWDILGDAAHKITNAQLYRVDEVLEIYQRITAPTLAVEATDNQMARWWDGKYTLDEYHERLKQVPQLTQALITDAGHMLHHDQPRQLAGLIENFVA
ncbi:MAG: alpha/beta hydrolase [Gammaproteobacteria bacterium]|nr:alpha/beta hydrolase [Gammaproteobacteria bacterium]MBU0787838.1 alpha/beta hydrolase [Gammaproteobacteria bacterium]MBU0817044.1 alpha/beta hydrolase [Gammaproteobacteria bacterium]MBU1787208.1 alpha/beta hydrolase [Gammaproteobacteria bacterium]